MIDPALARKTWRRLEPVHGMVYFAPEAVEQYAAVGIEHNRMQYFSSRSAPMGAVPAEVVVATFFNFNPDLIRRAIPAAWAIASPETILAARLRGVDAALRRALGDTIGSPEMKEAAGLARIAAEGGSEFISGRPLFAGHAHLPWPDEPHLALWHAQSLLREFRGDGHIGALLVEGLTGVQALVIHGATGEVPPAALQQSRAWGDDAWNAAIDEMRSRGLVEPTGDLALTEAGRTHRQWVEDRTDALSVPAYAALGEEGTARLGEIGRHFSRAVIDSGLLPFGVPSRAKYETEERPAG